MSNIVILKVSNDRIDNVKLNLNASDDKYSKYKAILNESKSSIIDSEYFKPLFDNYYILFGKDYSDDVINDMALKKFGIKCYCDIYIMKKSNRCSLLDYSFETLSTKDIKNILNYKVSCKEQGN